jgi:predicted DNA-binding transcriptional regulator YafY
MIILNKLDRREKVTVRSLMDDLEIKERSVHRYIDTLITAGFPMSYDRRKTSYVFDEGYTLRRPDFSPEEALTFGLAKRLLRSLGPEMETNLGRIEEKIAMPRRDVTQHMVLAPESLPEDIARSLSVIHDAAIAFRRLEITYKALTTGEATKRRVDPYYLFYEEGFWQLRGYCHLRKQFRIFALDRIGSLKVLDEYFVPQKVSWEDDLSASFAAWVDGEPTKVVLRFDPEIRQYIERKKWHQSQTQRDLPDGSLEVAFTVNGIGGIRPWIYRWMPFVEVIAPDDLRKATATELRVALKKHENDG